jgi:hypothetical protein
MAIHPDIQDEVVEQIMAVVGPDDDPVQYTKIFSWIILMNTSPTGI